MRKFIELVKQNPDLPVLARVNYEVVAGDDFAWWLGEVGEASVEEYICMGYYGEDRLFFKDDDDHVEKIEEYLYEKIEDDHTNNGKTTHYVSEELLEEKTKVAFEQLEWKKAIFVGVGLPDIDLVTQ